MITREAEEVRLVKERSRTAIDLAMRGEWAEAAQVNRSILDLSPTNVEAMNRLGKALLELGQPEQARDVFLSALVLHPSNPIALKNVARLRAEAEGQGRADGSRPAWARARASGRLIAESTKSAEVVLLSAGAPAVAAPGAPVTLGFRGAVVVVSDEYGACLGLLPPSLSRRLSALMSGGNRYEGVVVSAGDDGAVRVLLRETHQHPSQRGKASFLPAPPPPENALLDEIDADSREASPSELLASSFAPLDDEPELAAAGAGIGIMDDGVMPELPEEVFA